MNKIDEIIKQYKEGSSISKLLELYPSYNRRSLTKLLKDNGIAIRGGRKKKELTDEQIEHIKKMIDEGAFLIEVAEYCNLNKETMRLRLQELGLTIQNTNRINRRIKSDYFSVVDAPEKAYWLGFLFTDGSVDHYRATGRIRLQLQEQDIEILEKFKEDLGLDSKIVYDTRVNSTCCSVEFVDEQMFNDLGKYGIIPQKTYKQEHILYDLIPDEYIYAFILGLFDGDGCLTYSENCSSDVTFGFTSYHEAAVRDFQFLIDTYVLNKQKSNQPIFTSAWHVNWRGRLQVLKILDKLYENCPRHLNRKYEKYLHLKSSLN